MSLPLVVASCTRTNPRFGSDGGGSDGGSSTGATSVGNPTVSATLGDPDGSASDVTGPQGDSSTGEVRPECGDHVREGDEQCDLGDMNRDDGLCLSDCRINVCGDEHIGPGQPCDDGNEIDEDACSNDCELLTCLNGMLDEGELCDPTAQVGSVDCTQKCQPNECHDHETHGDEQCDDGDLDNTDDCVDECVLASCGDTHVWAGQEDCDDGNDDNTDACVSCSEAECGDGFMQLGVEDCDPELPASFACGTHGFSLGEGACSGSCDLDVSDCTNCGDGQVSEGEECDFAGLVDCGTLGFDTEGSVACGECAYELVDGDCCVPAGQPCHGPDGSDLCCHGCGKGDVCNPG